MERFIGGVMAGAGCLALGAVARMIFSPGIHPAALFIAMGGFGAAAVGVRMVLRA